MADLALGVRERVGDLVARRRLLEGHLVRVDGVEREADVDADVAHAAADRAPLEDACHCITPRITASKDLGGWWGGGVASAAASMA